MEESHRLQIMAVSDAFRRRARWLVASSMLVLAVILALVGLSGYIVRGVITKSAATVETGTAEDLDLVRDQLHLAERSLEAYRQQFDVGMRGLDELADQEGRVYSARQRLVEAEARIAAAKDGEDVNIDGKPFTKETLRRAHRHAEDYFVRMAYVHLLIEQRAKAGVAGGVDLEAATFAKNEATLKLNVFDRAMNQLGLKPLEPTVSAAPAPVAKPSRAPAAPAGPRLAQAGGAAVTEELAPPQRMPAPQGGAAGPAPVESGIVKVPKPDESNAKLILYYVTQFSGVLVMMLTISILLPIYRYNVQLATYYQARADSLRILAITGREKFEELVRALTPDFSFDRSANSPLGALVDVVKGAAAVVKR